MKILISNDDGIYAPGIRVLAEKLAEENEVTVVAPLEERSTTGHTLSLDNPLRITNIKENYYGLSGYPADCTLIGLDLLRKKDKVSPDLVVSGINRGGNLGQDIYYSGTVAAAREASFHGVPSIAISSVCELNEAYINRPFYSIAASFVSDLISNGVKEMIRPHTVLNINVPNCPRSEIRGVSMAELGFRRYSEEISEREDFRGRPYYWIGGVYKGYSGGENTDCALTQKNIISLSCLNLLKHSADNENTEKWNHFLKKLGW